MSALVTLVGLIVGGVALVAFFRPLPDLGVDTRQRAGGLLCAAFVLLVLGGALAPEAEQTERAPTTPTALTFSQVNMLFGMEGSLTDLQKEHEWPKYKGTCVQWTGIVAHLEESVWGGFTVGFKHLPQTFTYDVLVSAPQAMQETLLGLRKGQAFTYTATLQDYGTLLPLQADWGCD